MESCLAEITAMSRLRHPNIIEYLGSSVGVSEEGEVQLVVVMELCRRSLADLLSAYALARRKMPYKEQLRIARDVARGLAWMHFKG
mgnify:FL=1